MLPDYANDLNVMHEAEGRLDDEANILKEEEGEETQMDLFLWNLEQVISGVKAEDDIYKYCIHATARQRAEALLKTIGKWQEVGK